MTILFLTLSRVDDVRARGIYTDLMRELIRRGNEVYIASPTERRFGKPTHTLESKHCHILRVKTLNVQKTNIVEKGIGTLLLEWQFYRAIKHVWSGVKFDLVMFSTPPITFNKVIRQIRKRDGARTYLLLKDIFPQNAVDLGMFGKGSLFYKLFRRKECELYRLSDRIGCMSPANCRFVTDHNPEVDPAKVEICPNAIEIMPHEAPADNERAALRGKLNIPTDKVLAVYGGNLGRPQGIDFLIETIKSNEKRDNSFMLIVGSGTEFGKLQRWFDEVKPRNAALYSALPKDEYDRLIRCADIGLIFLDHRFTIPNFPSRLLSYQEAGIPVMIASDSNSDQGAMAETNGFGLWAESNDLPTFDAKFDKLINDSALRARMGANGRRFLEDNYHVRDAAEIILNSL